MSDVRRSQSRAILTVVAAVASLAAVLGACTTSSYLRSNGEACQKDVDCLSNYCRAAVCASPPAILNGTSYEEAGIDASDGASPPPPPPTPEASTSDTGPG